MASALHSSSSVSLRQIAFLITIGVTSISVSGCRFFVRAGVGPVIDTRGNSSFETTLTLGVGPAIDSVAVSAVAAVGSDNRIIGVEASDKSFGNGAAHLGVGYRSREIARDLTLRGISMRLGAGYNLQLQKRRRRKYFSTINGIVLGIEAEAGYLWAGSQGRGLFAFPLYLEIYETL